MKEIQIINGFVKYFLPHFGPAIENLILYGSLTINDNTVIDQFSQFSPSHIFNKGSKDF